MLILPYLQNALIKPDFDRWNWTSFKYMIALLDVHYGTEIQCNALQLVEQFYEQYTEKPRFPEKSALRAEIDQAKQDNGLCHTTEIEQQFTDYA